MGFCANNGAADNISNKPKNVNVPFILLCLLNRGTWFFEFLRDEAVPCSCLPAPARKACMRHEFSSLPSSNGVTRRGLHLQSWISRVAAASGFWLVTLSL